MLVSSSYTIPQVLCWGLCKDHYAAAYQEGCSFRGVVHLTIALLETLPILSQIISTIEYIVFCCLRSCTEEVRPPPPRAITRTSRPRTPRPPRPPRPNPSPSSNSSSSSSSSSSPSPSHNSSSSYSLMNDFCPSRHDPAVLQISDEERRAIVDSITSFATARINALRSRQRPPTRNRKLLATVVRNVLEKACPVPTAINGLIVEYTGSWEFEIYRLLRADNHREEARDYIIPPRRVCNFSNYDYEIRPDKIARTELAIFIREEEFVRIHPMRFLRNSPLVKPLPQRNDCSSLLRVDEGYIVSWDGHYCELIKELHAVALTQGDEPKHVILQQGIKSYIFTCIAMIALDRGKTPNYTGIHYSETMNRCHAYLKVEGVGLSPILTHFYKTQHVDICGVLTRCVHENGPGVLIIIHPNIGEHAVVLDAISERENTAMIRDPFHGWSLTMHLSILLSWVNEDLSYFLQAKRP